MGIYYQTNLGPYVECTTIMVDKAETVRGCPQCKTHVYDAKTKFCDKCGMAIGQYEKTFTTTEVDTDEIREEIEEALVLSEAGDSEAVHFWTNNYKAEGYVSMNVHRLFEKNHSVLDLTDIDIPKECDAFEQQFSRALSVLRERYGEQNVKIRWGVVAEAS